MLIITRFLDIHRIECCLILLLLVLLLLVLLLRLLILRLFALLVHFSNVHWSWLLVRWHRDLLARRFVWLHL